jgi:hypothetical protein
MGRKTAMARRGKPAYDRKMTNAELNDERVSKAMRQALRLCLAGQHEAGLTQFRLAFQQNDSCKMPVPLYLRILQDAGQAEAADRLRNLALRAGANLNLSVFLPNASDEARLAEYLTLFGAKLVNTPMIADYLKLLSRMGMGEEIADHHSGEIIRSCFLDGANDAAATIDPDLVRDEILERIKSERGRNRSVVNADLVHLVNVDDIPEKPRLADMPETRRLIDAAEAIGRAFKANSKKDNSLFWAMEPDDIALTAWAVVATDAGHVTPHFHDEAWMAGVFYAAAPEWARNADNEEGNLRIGRPQDIPAGAPGWPNLSFAPVPGRFVLMPAYAVHWTVPLGRPGLRISIGLNFRPCD